MKITDGRTLHFLEKDIILCEKGYMIKTAFSSQERIQAFRLRHLIFCEELRWVRAHDAGLEFDQHDNGAHFLGVFNEHNTLLAFIRVIRPHYPFMIEKDFSSLVDPFHKIKKAPKQQRHREFASRLMPAISL